MDTQNTAIQNVILDLGKSAMNVAEKARRMGGAWLMVNAAGLPMRVCSTTGDLIPTTTEGAYYTNEHDARIKASGAVGIEPVRFTTYAERFVARTSATIKALTGQQ